MLRMAIFDELAADEADEMDLITDVRNRQRHRRRLRAELLTNEGGRVAVRACLHLLPGDVERPLRQRLRELEDELALLRYTPNRQLELVRVVEQRDALAAFLDEHTPVIVTAVGRAPAGGPDWSLTDVPLPILDAAERHYAALRAALVAAIDNVVDSELLAFSEAEWLPHGDHAELEITELEITEHDPDAVAALQAFVADVRTIGAATNLLRDRLRLAALRGSIENPRDWLLGARLRRRDARNALERSRAIHAALAEVAMLDRGAGPDRGAGLDCPTELTQ